MGGTTRAPLARQRAASGMSEVTQTSRSVIALGDPVIGRVGPIADQDHLDIRQAGRPQWPRPVPHDKDGEAQPGRDAIHLLTHRAGIGIDINVGHRAAVPVPPRTSS